MRRSRTDVEDITNQVSGKSVSHVRQPEARRLEIHFTDGSILVVELLQDRLAAALACSLRTATGNHFDGGPRATRRQREYLEFIARYMRRFGISPAESDIGRHFLVSAPSVNQMVQTLERQGFITRQRGVPRSISIVDDAKQLVRDGELAAPGDLRPNKPLHRTGG
ncbi:MAG: LexA family protein, partial [bacterium]